MKHRVYCSVEQ